MSEQSSAGHQGPTTARRGWLRVGLIGVGTGLAVGLGAVWFTRTTLVENWIIQSLRDRGVDSAVRVTAVDFGGLGLSGLRLGPTDNPDLTAEELRIDLRWGLFGPRLEGLAAQGPRLRLISDETGLRAPGLEALLPPAGPPGAGVSLPALVLTITDGQVDLVTPEGSAAFSLNGAGRLGQDFAGLAALTGPADLSVGGVRLAALQGGVRVRTPEVGAIGFALEATAEQAGPLRGARLQADYQARLATLDRGPLVASVTALANAATPVSARLTGQVEAGGLSGRLQARADRPSLQHLQAEALALDAALTVTTSPDGPELALRGAADGRGVSLSGPWLSAALSVLPRVDFAPAGPLLQRGRASLTAGLSDADLDLPFALRWQGQIRVLEVERIALNGRNGVELRLGAGSEPLGQLDLVTGTYTLSGQGRLAGPELGPLVANAVQLRGQGFGFEANAQVAIPNWRGAGAELSAPSLSVVVRQQPSGGGALEVSGPVRMSGPSGLGLVSGLQMPLDLAVSWGNGVRVRTAGGACLPLRFARLRTPVLDAGAGVARLCPGPEGLYGLAPDGALSGGFTVSPLSLAGTYLTTGTGQLDTGPIAGRFVGVGDTARLELAIDRPGLTAAPAAGRTLAVQGTTAAVSVPLRPGPWQVNGTVQLARVEDTGVPVLFERVSAGFQIGPDPTESGAAVIAFTDGRALVSAAAPPPDAPDPRPPFQPVWVSQFSGRLAQGTVEGTGGLALVTPEAALGRVQLDHNLSTAVGSMVVTAPGLSFGSRLQPFHISELSRGVVDNVRGVAGGEVRFDWSAEATQARAVVTPRGLSLSTLALPVIRGVNGSVEISDLFTLSTPAGQVLTVEEISAGFPLRQGRMQFQLRPGGVIALEQASWPFAGGLVQIGQTLFLPDAEQTEVLVLLRGLDAATLVRELDVPDLTATGQLEGRMPLVLSATSARVENGEIRAAAGGGTLSYTGPLPTDLVQLRDPGVLLAFEALRDFSYDDLVLSLNGELTSSVVNQPLTTSVSFGGRDRRGALRLDEAVRTPGWLFRRQATADPRFEFDLTVRAPFTSLARYIASLTDVTAALDLADTAEPTPPSPVDPPPAPGR